ncbi:MAG: hypothetical protein QOJ07_702 [Thermoleophilaceae bacterium]|nr:hypothetical protein [Thermoleophilaceae bacterium]
MAGDQRLRIVSGASIGSTIDIDGDFIVGRGETGMGNLAGDPEISRRHARFRRTGDGQVLLEDLGSTNGTFVNGQRLTAPALLNPGDRISLGHTVLQFGEPVAAAAPVGAPPAAVAQAAILSPPPSGRPVATGGGNGAPPGGGYRPQLADSGRVRRRGILLSLLALLIVAGIVVAIVLSGGDDKKKSKVTGGGPSTVAGDCGKNIGAQGKPAYVAYVESNALNGKNSVIAVPYSAGDMKPMAMSQCATGGSGSTDLFDSGVLDANDQILVNSQHTLLFAVNQGSDTIAVFQIQANGGLQPVAGSPFPSQGKGPSSLGLSANTLVVSNKAQDGVRDLTKVRPNYTTFTVAGDGKLTPVPNSNIEAEPGSSPTDASVPAAGGVVFGTEESGPIRGFSVDPSGVIKQAADSPYDPPAPAYTPNFDDSKKFALGVIPHPTQKIVYIGLPTVPALAVYSYDDTGKLTFEKSVPVAGTYLPCWIDITKDGHWLYTSNADTDNVAAFDTSDPKNPKQIQTLGFQTPGNPWNERLSPDDKFLFVNTPRDTLKVPEGEGNTQHVLKIGGDGTLTEISADSPTKLPVPKGANPQGIAVIQPRG